MIKKKSVTSSRFCFYLSIQGFGFELDDTVWLLAVLPVVVVVFEVFVDSFAKVVVVVVGGGGGGDDVVVVGAEEAAIKLEFGAIVVVFPQ